MEQFITAQTLAKELIAVSEALSDAKANQAEPGELSHTVESQLLDSLGEDCAVSYRVENKVVTVVKSRGEASKILVSDLIS